MEYQLDFSEQAQLDIAFFKVKGDFSSLNKILKLLQEITVHPFTGTGKPEKLKYNLSGCWSRRINKEDRLIYEIVENRILIHSVRGHYHQK